MQKARIGVLLPPLGEAVGVVGSSEYTSADGLYPTSSANNTRVLRIGCYFSAGNSQTPTIGNLQMPKNVRIGSVFAIGSPYGNGRLSKALIADVVSITKNKSVGGSNWHIICADVRGVWYGDLLGINNVFMHTKWNGQLINKQHLFDPEGLNVYWVKGSAKVEFEKARSKR